jgi:uncharacterized C2H2 Zn-finger protein
MRPDRTDQTDELKPSASEAQTPVGEDLHVCPYCGGNFVYPLDWNEEGPWHWRIVLRCPECERVGTGVFPQETVDRFDTELERASGELLSDLRRLTHSIMADEVRFFIRALRADVIVPSDF